MIENGRGGCPTIKKNIQTVRLVKQKKEQFWGSQTTSEPPSETFKHIVYFSMIDHYKGKASRLRRSRYTTGYSTAVILCNPSYPGSQEKLYVLRKKD